VQRSLGSWVVDNSAPQSWAFDESEIKRCEYQDDAHIHRQPLPQPVPEEQHIGRDHHDHHQGYVERNRRVASHPNPFPDVGG
jgi:hypothetical protein